MPAPAEPRRRRRRPPASDLSEYIAVFHAHSSYSHDGRGSVEDVAATASRAGVRVVFLTDHNTLAPLAEDKEGWHSEVLVPVGAEITTGSGYLLVLDPRSGLPTRARGFALDELVRGYREAGAIMLLAHPEHPRLGCRDAVPETDGREVIDVFDQLMAAPLGRKVVGLAAHGGIALTEETDMVVRPHETALRLGRLHFVTAEPLRGDAADRPRLYRAMRAGRFYNALDGFAPAEGFRFEIRLGEDRALLGATVPFRPGQAALIEIPPVGDAMVRLLRDGAVLREAPADTLLRIPLPGPGVYRAEVDLRVDLFLIGGAAYRAWIFSNRVYVRG